MQKKEEQKAAATEKREELLQKICSMEALDLLNKVEFNNPKKVTAASFAIRLAHVVVILAELSPSPLCALPSIRIVQAEQVKEKLLAEQDRLRHEPASDTYMKQLLEADQVLRRYMPSVCCELAFFPLTPDFRVAHHFDFPTSTGSRSKQGSCGLQGACPRSAALWRRFGQRY